MDAPQNAIEAIHLRRVFSRAERGSGLKAALKNFVSPRFIEKVAVDDVSFHVPRASCVGVVGANGAGKTTLLKMCAGLLHPTSGSIRVLGSVPAERERSYLKRIGMVMGQKSQLWVDIPAGDSFDLLASIYEVPAAVYKQRLDELVKLFGVEKHLGVQVRRLSLGERMKFEIIASLLHRPDLLIMDEPTIGLDLLAKDTIRDFIREYNRLHRTTILLSSHDMDDILEICDRLLIVARGKIRFNGTVEEFRSASHTFTHQIRELLKE